MKQRLILMTVLGTALVAACGGSSAPAKPVAVRICTGAQAAAAHALGHRVDARIVARDPADLKCVLRAARVRVSIGSQATAQAYTEFDTEVSHQDQVYGPGVHTPGQIPVNVSVPGAVAAVWIPAQSELVATSASPGGPGAYVTVTVAGPVTRGPDAKALALAVAHATFRAHPGAGQ